MIAAVTVVLFGGHLRRGLKKLPASNIASFGYAARRESDPSSSAASDSAFFW
jgi:hypothetical protein